jgi:hypothetical protein
VNTAMNLEVPRNAGKLLLAAQLAASQKGFRSIKLVIQ